MKLYFSLALFFQLIILQAYAEVSAPQIPGQLINIIKNKNNFPEVTVLGHKYQYIDSKKNEVISNFIDSIYLEIFDTPVGFQMFKDIFHTSVLYEQSIQTKYHEYYYDNFVMLMNHALGIKRKTA